MTINTSYNTSFSPTEAPALPAASTDQTLRAAHAVDLTLDLSRSSRNVIGAVLGLDNESLQEFLRITGDLVKAGVVGRETVEVNGQPRETFVDARMADPALRGAQPYRRLDARA